MNERTNNWETTTVSKMQANINFFTDFIQELYKNTTDQLQ